MKLKTKLTGVVVAVAVALPLIVPGGASAQTAPLPAERCVFMHDGSGRQVCFTPFLGAEVAGIQIGDVGSGPSALLPVDPQVEVAGVQLSPTLGLAATCVFEADQAVVQTCRFA